MRWWPRRKVRKNKTKTNLGNVLIAMGAATEEQVTEAKKKQDEEWEQIGKILVALGYISEEQLGEALILQKQMRNGKSIDAMIEIVHRRFDRTHERLTAERLAKVEVPS